MTTTPAPQDARGRRTERRSIPPFGDGADPNSISNLLENVLAKCRFAPFTNVTFNGQDTYFLDGDEAYRPIEPRFQLLVDRIDELSELLGISEDDLEVGLSVRSQHLRKYEVLQRWNIDAVPSEPWSPDARHLHRLQSGRGMDFVLAIRITANRDGLSRRGLDQGKVICRKVFAVRESSDSLIFPFRWEEFGDDGHYPKEALWALEWATLGEDDLDFARPADELLTVVVNLRAEATLKALGDVPRTNDLAWRMLAADIATQIFADVLSKIDGEPEEDDSTTLAGQVFARLSRAGGLNYGQVKELARQDDSLLELRNLVCKMLKVVV